MRIKTLRRSPKRTISASGGPELLQYNSPLDEPVCNTRESIEQFGPEQGPKKGEVDLSLLYKY